MALLILLRFFIHCIVLFCALVCWWSAIISKVRRSLRCLTNLPQIQYTSTVCWSRHRWSSYTHCYILFVHLHRKCLTSTPIPLSDGEVSTWLISRFWNKNGSSGIHTKKNPQNKKHFKTLSTKAKKKRKEKKEVNNTVLFSVISVCLFRLNVVNVIFCVSCGSMVRVSFFLSCDTSTTLSNTCAFSFRYAVTF